MEHWFTAALDYARQKGDVGGFLLLSAGSYLAWRVLAKVGAVAGSAANTAWVRYDKLLADWEEMNRRKNDELRAKELEIRALHEQLRQARAELAVRHTEEGGANARRSRR